MLQGTSKEAAGLNSLKNFFGILNFCHQVAPRPDKCKTHFGTFEGFLTKKIFFSSRHILTRISSRIFWGLDPACGCPVWRTARKVSSGQLKSENFRYRTQFGQWKLDLIWAVNFRIFLFFRFYVKSISTECRSPKTAIFSQFYVHLGNLNLQKNAKIHKKSEFRAS